MGNPDDFESFVEIKTSKHDASERTQARSHSIFQWIEHQQEAGWLAGLACPASEQATSASSLVFFVFFLLGIWFNGRHYGSANLCLA
jgi:hypothetical protein